MTDPAFVDHCLELLAPPGRARARRMFGGHGLYVDDVFIALIIDERLYLKADAASRSRFEAAGCEPFAYDGRGQRVTTSYWSAPPEAMESPAAMAPWARDAMRAALGARAGQASAARRPAPADAVRRPKPRSTAPTGAARATGAPTKRRAGR